MILTLSNISGSGGLGAQTTHTATLTDDEGATVAFTAATSATASEAAANHAVTVTLTTTGGGTLASALTVNAASTGGTATAGTDYNAVAVTLTFPAASANGAIQTVNIPVLADTFIEGNETVVLTLSSVSANGALGAQTTHTATITDDEATPTVAFTAAASATVSETASNHAVTVTLTTAGGATLASALTVDAANTGGTATAGTDYTAVAVTVTFPATSANGSTQTVNVPVLADLVIEGSETVVLTLSNVSANGALGAQTTHTATLTDDDGPATVAFNAASSATASEAAANHAVTLRLTTGGATLAGALTVDVASTNGTAIAGSDYTAVAATVTFAGGSGDGATQDANVPVLADVLVEGNETLTLTLSNVSSNGSLGAQTTHTVTITDDDATPPPQIETIAGDGTGAFLGDGGAATAARIQNERGVYPDASGNFWIGDTDNHRVRKVTAATGFISTVAGNGTAGANGDGAAATSAQLNTPFTVWVDPLGNLLLADRSNGKMRKVDAHTANISTVAGVGAAVPLGDGGPATDAHLNSPIGITVDASGHLLISDTSNHRIRKVDVHTGVITTVAGSGTGDFAGDGAAATAAQIKAPFHVALAANGDIYIADAQNNRVRKVTAATGFISTLAGDGTTGYTGDGAAATAAGLSNPVGVALDSAGDVYISDENHHVIRKVTVGTGVITTAVGDGTGGFLGDGGAATGARLNFPGQIAFDSAGRLYIADRNNQRVRRVYNLKSLSVSTAALARSPTNAAYRQAVRATGGSGSGYAWTVASGALPAGLSLTSGTPDAIISGTPTATGTSSFTLAVQDSESFAATRALSIVVGTPQLSTAAGDGLAGFAGDGGAATAARLNAPPGVAADSDGNVYIADATNHRVRKLTVATGVISTVAGDGTAGFLGDGGAATSARLDDPVAVAVDAAGNLYIADRDNHRIRRVLASAGTISTIVGDGTAGFAGDGADGTAARINTPTGVAVDLAGNVFIADQGNHRVRRLEAHIGHVTTYAGNGTQGFGGDGAAATAAQLDTPTGVAVDTAGNVYVADRGNHRVRKVTASTGNIATIAGDGTAGSTGDGGAATSARLSSPSALAVDGALNVYIADRDNHKIRRVDGTTAGISTAVGDGTAGSLGDGGAATAGRLDTPQGVAVDASGNLHVADTNNHRARKATP
ncbi:MAG: hypothetical protein HY722_03665 [Planctomycetes bacterium]|nr:hypothetical protein [Planctomycetota bacterium]